MRSNEERGGVCNEPKETLSEDNSPDCMGHWTKPLPIGPRAGFGANPPDPRTHADAYHRPDTGVAQPPQVR